VKRRELLLFGAVLLASAVLAGLATLTVHGQGYRFEI
jgi:hypothetical protein